MIVKPEELSSVIKQQIKAFSSTGCFKVRHGLQVGDGIACVYGLYDAMSGEL